MRHMGRCPLDPGPWGRDLHRRGGLLLGPNLGNLLVDQLAQLGHRHAGAFGFGLDLGLEVHALGLTLGFCLAMLVCFGFGLGCCAM
jgi:hypothetical protein